MVTAVGIRVKTLHLKGKHAQDFIVCFSQFFSIIQKQTQSRGQDLNYCKN
jgi:hypothetical protein